MRAHSTALVSAMAIISVDDWEGMVASSDRKQEFAHVLQPLSHKARKNVDYYVSLCRKQRMIVGIVRSEGRKVETAIGRCIDVVKDCLWVTDEKGQRNECRNWQVTLAVENVDPSETYTTSTNTVLGWLEKAMEQARNPVKAWGLAKWEGITPPQCSTALCSPPECTNPTTLVVHTTPKSHHPQCTLTTTPTTSALQYHP